MSSHNSMLTTEFINEITGIESLATLCTTLEAFASESTPELLLANEEYVISKANTLKSLTVRSSAQISKIYGILCLYIVGAFESYIRRIFEEYSLTIATKYEHFSNFPQNFRKELIRMTSEVTVNPKKYRIYSDNIVHSYINNLSEMIKNTHITKIGTINEQCLSATDRNMNCDMIHDLFNRTHKCNIIENIANESKMKGYFETTDAAHTQTMIKDKINKCVEMRNSIAHPTASTVFPRHEKISELVSFFCCFAVSLDNVLDMHIKSVKNSKK